MLAWRVSSLSLFSNKKNISIYSANTRTFDNKAKNKAIRQKNPINIWRVATSKLFFFQTNKKRSREVFKRGRFMPYCLVYSPAIPLFPAIPLLFTNYSLAIPLLFPRYSLAIPLLFTAIPPLSTAIPSLFPRKHAPLSFYFRKYDKSFFHLFKTNWFRIW